MFLPVAGARSGRELGAKDATEDAEGLRRCTGTYNPLVVVALAEMVMGLDMVLRELVVGWVVVLSR